MMEANAQGEEEESAPVAITKDQFVQITFTQTLQFSHFTYTPQMGSDDWGIDTYIHTYIHINIRIIFIMEII